jgi:hypothetical protein
MEGHNPLEAFMPIPWESKDHTVSRWEGAKLDSAQISLTNHADECPIKKTIKLVANCDPSHSTLLVNPIVDCIIFITQPNKWSFNGWKEAERPICSTGVQLLWGIFLLKRLFCCE